MSITWKHLECQTASLYLPTHNLCDSFFNLSQIRLSILNRLLLSVHLRNHFGERRTQNSIDDFGNTMRRANHIAIVAINKSKAMLAILPLFSSRTCTGNNGAIIALKYSNRVFTATGRATNQVFQITHPSNRNAFKCNSPENTGIFRSRQPFSISKRRTPKAYSRQLQSRPLKTTRLSHWAVPQ